NEQGTRPRGGEIAEGRPLPASRTICVSEGKIWAEPEQDVPELTTNYRDSAIERVSAKTLCPTFRRPEKPLATKWTYLLVAVSQVDTFFETSISYEAEFRLSQQGHIRCAMFRRSRRLPP